ncbi:hypothetical protein HanXRQr2_Chr12g0533661 [Helianthus annuus]|uniref:Uncharacterized protein n=1 Tax=Helianthus annuus TaxID=4232 RepID=A0A9K3HFB0_HELAN|nr:hypothetical protein HanXRQr2_Chr12g0533661 [Helianthus annuus]KAJ0862082.1 hypothetical protein HanPSC8_Chr12g0514001 [Helianthus annuus]
MKIPNSTLKPHIGTSTVRTLKIYGTVLNLAQFLYQNYMVGTSLMLETWYRIIPVLYGTGGSYREQYCIWF